MARGQTTLRPDVVAADLLGAAMTDHRIRDLRRLLESEAERFGATVRVEHTNGGHLKGIFSLGEHEVFIIASSSSSTWRCDRYVRTDARRALRNLIA